MSIAEAQPRKTRPRKTKPAGREHPPRPPSAVPQFPVARITVPEYLSLVESGFFADRRVELWEGWVVDRMSHGPVSAMVIAFLTRWFVERMKSSVVRPQLPIKLKASCPEPDLALVGGNADDYATRHPNPDEIHLLVEVSDSTLADDRDIKARMYAAAGIREYWIVNCIDRQVEVQTDPQRTGATPRYRRMTTYLPGQSIAVHVAGKKLGDIKVHDLFGGK